ncbi:hypothetical protein BZA77DRAFT_321468 [Pyronema omphalodes]|nr:hypothetical protein BZA77DRAFT_321468 [Pyronema omphalodes]
MEGSVLVESIIAALFFGERGFVVVGLTMSTLFPSERLLGSSVLIVFTPVSSSGISSKLVGSL